MRIFVLDFVGVIALFCLTVSILRADTISVSGDGSSFPNLGQCNNFGICPQMEIDIPKFDPTLGVLQSIDFKLSVDQEVRYGVNDLYDPETGVPYEVTVTGGISATALPINVQNEQILSLESNGAGQVSQGSYFFENFISTSGTDSNALDLAAFEGTGNIAVLFQPFASAMVTSAYDYPFAGLVNITEYSSTLDITYNYVSAVPEPRGYSLLLGLILIGGVVKKLRPTQI